MHFSNVYTTIKFSFRNFDTHSAQSSPKIPLKTYFFPEKKKKRKKKWKETFLFVTLVLFENLYFIYFCSFYVAKLNLFLDLLHTKSGFMKHFTHFNLYITRGIYIHITKMARSQCRKIHNAYLWL